MSKKDFSVALKYVEARPRSQRRKGAEARVSGISVVGSGASATDLSLLQANLISVTNNFTALKDLFDSMFEKDSDGNIHAKLSLWSSGGITAGGVGSGGSGGGGGISYNRLDSWSDYSADKSGWVLSALLGNDLNTRLISVENAGYITTSALAPYALRSEIPSLVGYATQSWVGENYLSKSGGRIIGEGYYAGVQLRLSGSIANIIFEQYEVEKGCVGWMGNTGIRLQNSNGYGLAVKDSNDPIFYWGENGSVQRILLHSGNYSDYAFPITGGTVNGDISIPVARATRDNSIPVSGGLDRYGKNYYDAVPELKTFIGTIESSDLGWQHTISVRHRNGYSDGATEGLVLRHSLVNVNDSIHWSHQRGGVWSDDRILLDSSNYSDYALPITGGRISGDLKLTSREVGNDNAHSGKLIFAGANNDYGNNDYKMGPYIQAINVGGWGKKKISFFQRDWSVEGFDADPEEVFSIMPNGNILIGSTEDSGEKLQVNGNVKANNFIGNLTGNADSATNADTLDGKHATDLVETIILTKDSNSLDLNSRKSVHTWLSTGWAYEGSDKALNQPWTTSAANVWTLPGLYPLQLARFYNSSVIKARGSSGSTWTDWKTIAFTDSNVASATKLATPRTIWGQYFDGTQNVEGNLTNVNRIRFSEAGAQIFVRGSNYSSGMTDNDIGIFATMTTFSGNVAIGGVAANEKLYVYGNGKFTGALTANSLTIGGVTLTYDSVNEALCINGNMYALGGITAGGAGISAYSSLETRVARLEQKLNIS